MAKIKGIAWGAFVLLVSIALLLSKKWIYQLVTHNVNYDLANIQSGAAIKPTIEQNHKDIEVIVQNLKVPWDVVFVDRTTFLLTERDGTLSKVELETNATARIQKIDGVAQVGEGGLLGIALDPDFQKNRKIYLYLTTKTGNALSNKVVSYEFDGTKLSNPQTILDGIKGSIYHDGGYIAFGPDGYLYVTTGDAENPSLAQDKKSLNGKILRIKSDGSLPQDNPFGNAVYSYGHRNAQGLTWDTNGILWETEHGPSGAQMGLDEVNVIEKGKNYGWPIIKGDEKKSGMVSPVIQSGTRDTWAPGQIIFYKGYILFTGLRGAALYEAKVDGNKLTDFRQFFKNQYGRLRAIVVGPDGYFYITTSNEDGRGTSDMNGDKIIRVNPKILSLP